MVGCKVFRVCGYGSIMAHTAAINSVLIPREFYLFFYLIYNLSLVLKTLYSKPQNTTTGDLCNWI